MRTFLVVAAVLVASAAAIDEEGKHFIDYRLVSNPTASFLRSFAQPRVVTCSAQGKICDPDCQRIWTCINKNGQLEPVLLQTCQGKQTCNNGTCSDNPSPECALAPNLKFSCQAEGVFPDPRTCKKYHYCIEQEDNSAGGGNGGGGGGNTTTSYFSTYAEELVDNERSCTYNRGYNPRTTYCDKVLVNDQCGADYPVPICKTPGQQAALKDNNSIFYVCSLYNNQGDVLYPYLYLCKDGTVYDGNYGCK